MGALLALAPAGRFRASDKTPRNRNAVARRLTANVRMARAASCGAYHVAARAKELVDGKSLSECTLRSHLRPAPRLKLLVRDRIRAMFKQFWRVSLTCVLACTAFSQTRSQTAVSKIASGLESATSTNAAAEVLAMERAMEAAVVRGDVAYVDSVSASDLTFTHGDGWTTG